MRVELRSVGVELGGCAVVDGVDLEVRPGEVVGLVGPNGSGKTTLLRTLYRALAPTTGTVLVEGHPVASLPRRRLAQRLGATVQEPEQRAALRVIDVVEQGRVCHQGWLEPLRAEDRVAVAAAIAATGLDEFRERDVRTLSGGERQRVAIARALAQQPRILVLDEPTNHLDLRHQLAILDLTARLAADGLAVLLTLHDLRLAVRYCDRLAVLSAGRLVAAGEPTEVLDTELLAEVFGVRAEIRPNADGEPVLDVLGLA
ncbi:ABC transporter ATP-binding protein [Longimycelium tulufanense]|uniref:ABC transporter ATP-binding protein n=1 Tax=Longimycelium tulufanense TaxID=907463 RepID=A0A8J3CJ34_9PSEU|nr:ABC transporter ATP-binding protein [Longimycelium tulufanense]GGM74788.1 ABC transporter ATP-binding protein [Longimycelium tulufanense]